MGGLSASSLPAVQFVHQRLRILTLIDYKHALSVQLRHRQVIDQLHVQTQLLECLCSQLISQIQAFLLGDQNKVLLQQQAVLTHAIFLGGFLVYLVQIDHQTLLDAKHCVGFLIGIPAKVHRTVQITWSQQGRSNSVVEDGRC